MIQRFQRLTRIRLSKADAHLTPYIVLPPTKNQGFKSIGSARKKHHRSHSRSDSKGWKSSTLQRRNRPAASRALCGIVAVIHRRSIPADLRCARARHHSSRMGSRGESKGAIEAIHGTELAMPRVADANDRKTVYSPRANVLLGTSKSNVYGLKLM